MTPSCTNIFLTEAVNVTMILSLPLYDFPEWKSSTQIWLSAIEKEARKVDLVSPTRLITQRCGWPLISSELGLYKVICVPKYNVQGCEEHFYAAAIIVQKCSDIKAVPDLNGKIMAVNSLTSCSGRLLPAYLLGSNLYSTITEVSSGSHLKSLEMVAEGQADFAGIDCVTLSYVKNVRPGVYSKLRVIALTPRFPAPPYVTTTDISELEMRALRIAIKKCEESQDPMLVEVKKTLFLHGFTYDELDCQSYDVFVAQIFGKLLDHNLPNPRLAGPDGSENDMKSFLLGRSLLDQSKVLEALQHIREGVARNLQWQEIELKDFRRVRVIYPGGPKDPWESSEQRLCVAFFGRRPRLHMVTSDFNRVSSLCSKADDSLCRDLFNSNQVDASLSMQVVPGGDFMNLVVLAKDVAVNEYKNYSATMHKKAMRDIAPKFYDRIWIHRCYVKPGKVDFKRTLALENVRGVNVYRQIFHW